MSARLKATIRRNEASGRQCEVQACFRPVEKISRYCVQHDSVNKRTGDPRGHTVRVRELRPYVATVTRYIKQHWEHPAIAEASRRVSELVYGARRRNVGKRPNATPQERLSGWLDRLEGKRVPPEELLCIVAAMFLYREDQPHAFKSDRHFQHQLAIRFLRKAPAPLPPRWWEGQGRKRYDRITVATRDFVAAMLTRAIGVACLGIARVLAHAINPYTPQQEAAIRSPLPSPQKEHHE